MEQLVKRRFLSVLKCLLISGSLYVFLLSERTLAESCKVERDNKDTILSENCVKRADGKIIVYFCDGKNKCVADKVQKVAGYKCQKKSPGTPSFCIDVKLFMNSIPVSATGDQRADLLKALESRNIKAFYVHLKTDKEFEVFRQVKSKESDLYLVYGKTNELKAACSSDERKLAAMVDISKPPSCDSIGNSISELPSK